MFEPVIKDLGMDPLILRKEWILDQERSFARELARAVIEVPKLSMWVILIPILLVYHLYRHNSAVKGRSAFAQHYLLSRTRSLEEAYQALAEQRPPDIEGVVAMAVDLPDTARQPYRDWITVLIRHYGDLLQAPGTDVKDLIHAVYRSHSNYLLLLNQLNRLEKTLNAALKNHVGEAAQSVIDTIARIETHSADLRRLQAAAIFS
jgi:hypothetical protein